jgi:ABC-type sugar transport system substrate-binding protein
MNTRRRTLPLGTGRPCCQGTPRSFTAKQRLAGLQEATAGAAVEVASCGGDWQPETARRAVRDWLRMTARGRVPMDLVACQNDHMASDALLGLADAGAELDRPELARLPVIGCDGLPSVGQAMVRDRQLVATVVLPPGRAGRAPADLGPRPAQDRGCPLATRIDALRA